MESIKRAQYYRINAELYSGLIDLILTLPLSLKGGKMIEIGSYIGESANIFSLFFGDVHCVDPHEDPETKKIFLKNTTGREIFLHSGRGDDVCCEFKDGEYGFVYIDAVHDYEHVKQDIKNYLPKVKAGGYIGGHDYDNEGVRLAVVEEIGEPDFGFEDTSWLKKKT
jgi:predicted O-methyltransferase YrrM